MINSYLITTLLGLGLAAVIYRRYFTSLRFIPGPFVASFTRLWHVRQIFTGEFRSRLMDLHEQHGHFVRISHNEVSLSHPDAISQVLLAPLKKAPWYRAMAWPDYRFQNQMSALEAKAHKEITKHLASGYTLTNLLQAEREMDSILEKLQRWLDHFAHTQSPMDLGEFFHYTIYDMTGEVFFSKPLGFLDAGSDIGDAIGMVVRLNRYAAIAGFFYELYTFLAANPIVTSMKILPMGYLNELTLKYLHERMEKAEARFDVVEHWLREHQRHPDRFTMRDIFSNVTFNIPAGSDSPANVMHAIIYYISRHPTAYQRIREEILTAMAGGRCQTTIVSYTDSKDLLYMQACIKETLRVFSALAVSIPRVAGKGGVTVGDLTFSEGTILSVNPWIIHYSKEFWGPDANEFNPNRWFEKDIAVREKYLISFGAGFNACPGRNLAQIELSKITATILRDYDIDEVNKGKAWDLAAHATVLPHNWPVYIKRRK